MKREKVEKMTIKPKGKRFFFRIKIDIGGRRFLSYFHSFLVPHFFFVSLSLSLSLSLGWLGLDGGGNRSTNVSKIKRWPCGLFVVFWEGLQIVGGNPCKCQSMERCQQITKSVQMPKTVYLTFGSALESLSELCTCACGHCTTHVPFRKTCN